MASGKKNLNSLRKIIEDLLNIERSHMCWELGDFQAPIFIKEPGGTPAKPYMLVCIEKPFLGISAAVLPESVHLGDPAALELVGNELGQLDVKVVLVKRLSALSEFEKIIERDLFSRH